MILLKVQKLMSNLFRMGDKMLTVAGIGPGNKMYITYAVSKAIESSDTIIAAKRILDEIQIDNKEIIDLAVGIDKIVEYINNFNKKDILILATGDIGFYSIAAILKKRLDMDIKFLSGISSLQYFCSKIGIQWNDIATISMHGRDENLIQTVKTNFKTFVLTGGKNSINFILNELYENKMGNLTVYTGENLSYENEKILNGKVYELKSQNFAELSVLLAINPNFQNKITTSIADSEFVRGNIPMTKSEIRAIVLSKMQLLKSHTVYDIGAGTGSISVECAIHSKKVYSIDYRQEALSLIQQNCDKFNLKNISIVNGKAPDILEGLPIADRVFIGGSDGNLTDIIKTVVKKNPDVQIVINAIMIETANKAIDCLESLGYEVDITHISISKSKKVTNGNMMIAQNPIYIIHALTSCNN